MAYFYLILLGSIWGASYLFIKVGGEVVPPLTLVFSRTAIASVVLFVTLRVKGERVPRWNDAIWKWFVLMGVINTVVPYTLITWGELYISSGLAAILIATLPIFTVLLAHWLTHDEKITPRKLLGVMAGFVGVVILFLPDLAQGQELFLAGGIAVLGAALSYAIAGIYARKTLKGVSPISSAFGQMLTAAVMILPASLLVERPWTISPTPASIFSILMLGVVGSGFAYILFYWLIAQVGATRTSLVTYVSPIVALILGAVILQEPLHWTMVVGLGLIIGGVGLVTNLQLSFGKEQGVAVEKANM
ncbi:MAG: EamA family transporter [Anaerolineae bacterium]|nr:EamA family transporter [Anaerolineae bacterium]